MKFGLVDSIVELTRGQRIVAVKAVSLAEEYLADHFPTFHVLPGVLMLQAMVEAATWLVREATEFAPAVILLREAKNVTYKNFVKPGNLLTLEVTCRRLARDGSDFEGIGTCQQAEVVKARFGLRHMHPRDAGGLAAACDEAQTSELRAKFALLRRGS